MNAAMKWPAVRGLLRRDEPLATRTSWRVGGPADTYFEPADRADLLDFTRLNALTFEEADAQRYPGLQLAWETLKGEAGSTCVLNAANEIAVEAFLARRIRFDQIHRVVVQSLSDCRIEHSATETVEGLLDLDGQARRVASSVVAGLAV